MPRKKVPMKDKKKFLNFVYLSDAEYSDLCEKLGKDATDNWVVELNGGIGQHGYKYESHYWTIRNWARRAGQKKTDAKRREPTRDDTVRAAADRFIADLKEFPSWPDMAPKTRAIIYDVLKAIGRTWPRLRQELIEKPEVEEWIRGEFRKAYSSADFADGPR